MEQEPMSPYDDLELQQLSAGDKPLLDRLVGLTIAKAQLDECPEDESAQQLYDNMAEAVVLRRIKLGLPPTENLLPTDKD